MAERKPMTDEDLNRLNYFGEALISIIADVKALRLDVKKAQDDLAAAVAEQDKLKKDNDKLKRKIAKLENAMKEEE